MKTCIHCGKQKHEKSFHVSGNGKRGNVCHACKRKKHEQNNPEYKRRHTRRRYLKHTYGISSSDYEDMYQKQSGKCAICSLQDKLYIDHCHDTGAIRGLLCNKCNSGIGFLNDDPNLLHNAYKYLRGASGSESLAPPSDSCTT